MRPLVGARKVQGAGIWCSDQCDLGESRDDVYTRLCLPGWDLVENNPNNCSVPGELEPKLPPEIVLKGQSRLEQASSNTWTTRREMAYIQMTARD